VGSRAACAKVAGGHRAVCYCQQTAPVYTRSAGCCRQGGAAWRVGLWVRPGAGLRWGGPLGRAAQCGCGIVWTLTRRPARRPGRRADHCGPAGRRAGTGRGRGLRGGGAGAGTGFRSDPAAAGPGRPIWAGLAPSARQGKRGSARSPCQGAGRLARRGHWSRAPTPGAPPAGRGSAPIAAQRHASRHLKPFAGGRGECRPPSRLSTLPGHVWCCHSPYHLSSLVLLEAEPSHPPLRLVPLLFLGAAAFLAGFAAGAAFLNRALIFMAILNDFRRRKVAIWGDRGLVVATAAARSCPGLGTDAVVSLSCCR
jgi:hypothetical protein